MLNAHSDALELMVGKLARQSPLNAVEIDALLGLPHRVTTCMPLTYLAREGDRSTHCTLLISGVAARFKMAGDGARQIVAVHVGTDLIDLQNSVLRVADHSVQALSHIDVALIPHQAILDLVAAYPAIGIALWRDSMIDASIVREWVLNVGRRTSRQRISHLLCELALRQEAAGISKRLIFPMAMTQEQIGDATGLTAVHVNRTLQGMRADGLISLTNRTLTINDWAKLQAAGDFNGAYLHLPAQPVNIAA